MQNATKPKLVKTLLQRLMSQCLCVLSSHGAMDNSQQKLLHLQPFACRMLVSH